jgi:alpha-glucuronidase
MRVTYKTVLIVLAFTFTSHSILAEDGYGLWLRYKPINNTVLLEKYRRLLGSWHLDLSTATKDVVRRELNFALPALLNRATPEKKYEECTLFITTLQSSTAKSNKLLDGIGNITSDGYVIRMVSAKKKNLLVIIGGSDIGALYGTFHLLRLLQTEQDISNLNVSENPKVKMRMLNHWDNLDRTVERGYAGFSIWDWHKLPGHIDARYHDYARVNASIGINGTVLTNVNANAIVLTKPYLQKVKALADVFRPYGIKVYLTARFNAPVELHELSTADPQNDSVKIWWKNKVQEIYTLIPDFGGFLVKANSEGQPGPQAYGRTHADGANLLATALKSYGGVVIWRAFVYDNDDKTDRAKQAYNEFKPLDGKFSDNTLLQVKNGPIDFQPREPYHPMFGGIHHTPLMMEFQITQEYLGFSTHLVYLAPLFKETLSADTYSKGEGSTVAKVIDGSIDSFVQTGIAGVANIGNDASWSGHPFAQANWYAFGRLAWNHELTSEDIAKEWTRMTFTNDKAFVNEVVDLMIASREAAVNYMTPLGLHHIMGWNHHYGPAPWISNKPRADWTSVYYHKADSSGIGFDRSASGSNALEQYSKEFQKTFGDVNSCPERYLLWFHHVSWDHKLRSGRTLWDELCLHYQSGVNSVAGFRTKWAAQKGKIDDDRFNAVASLLEIQYQESVWWKEACLLYFQQFSRRPFPSEISKPEKTLQYYQALEFPYAPGIKPKW